LLKENLVRNDVLERLRIDPGQRTLGQLLQDREAAAHEIERLRSQFSRLAAEGKTAPLTHLEVGKAPPVAAQTRKPPFRAGTLIRLTDVCELLGVSRSTIYLLLANGDLPEPVRVGQKAVRWQIDAIDAWRDARPARSDSRR
jgi:prophage regulatory protein